MKRSRIHYFIFSVLVMIIGLLFKKINGAPAGVLRDVLGDSLWALMVFFCWGFLLKECKTVYVAAIALVFSFSIEISQLYHAPWIDSIRTSRLGGLVFGSTFSFLDFFYYAIGILGGVLFEIFWTNRTKKV